MREYPHLKLERELRCLTEELELEREERTHNYRESQRLGEELERERLARLGGQRNVQRLQRDLQEILQQLLEERQALKAPKKGLWTNLLRSNYHKDPIRGSLSVRGTPFEMRGTGSALASYIPNSIK